MNEINKDYWGYLKWEKLLINELEILSDNYWFKD